jgi:uncharacterized protein
LPLTASLLARGIPLAPVLVFTFASPLIKPTAFMITIAFLGPKFALSLLMATTVIGLTLGWVIHRLSAGGWLAESVKANVLVADRPNSQSGCTAPAGTTRTWSELSLSVIAGVFRNARFVGKYVLLALALQVLLRRYVPSSLIMKLAGSQHAYSIALATVFGIPLYVNAASGPPLLAGLLDLGMARGAALGFMITGTAYSVPSLVTLMTILKRRAMVTFLLVGLAGGLLAGYLFQMFA